MHLQFKKTLSAAGAAVIAASMLSCNGYTDERETARTMDVTFHIVADGFTDTRSSFTWGENEIRDIQIVITKEDGSVFDVLYSDSSSELGFTGNVGSRYHIWAAANLGEKVDVHDLQDFTNGTRSITKAGIAASGIPMFNGPDGQEIMLTDDSGAVTVFLTRMLARVDLKVDTRLLKMQSQFNVKSVSIYNAINAYSPFTPAVRQEHRGRVEYTFDSASSSDVSILNRGGTISLYAFENMQGTLLPGNTDPWKKVPSSLGDAGDYCSYLEVDCSYGYDDVTYRMYLGKDATENFDVERNTVYRVTLMPTEKEIRGERGSWKVEVEPWNDVVDVELILDPSTLELKTGGDFAEITSHFLVTYEDGSTELEDAWAIWTSVGDALSYIEPAGRTPLDTGTSLRHMEIKGKSDGHATIKATAYYGDGKMLSATCAITVTHDPVYSEESEFELIAEPGSATISEGQQVQFSATLIERVYETVDETTGEIIPAASGSFVQQSLFENTDFTKEEEPRILLKDNRPRFRIIGQVFETYWLIQYESKLLVIDQHAAHEKVNYERLMRRLSANDPASSGSQLLAPASVVTLTGREEGAYQTHSEVFASMGYEIEPLGGSSYAIRAVPMELYGNDAAQLFKETLEEMIEEKMTGTPQAILSKIASMSCKAAVKGNSLLSFEEAQALIDELLKLDNPYHCPHGRPTMIVFSQADMDKKFKRIVS